MKINCSGYFEIEVYNKLSLEKWLGYFVEPLCDFLTFSTGKLNKFKRIYLHLEEENRLEVLISKMDFQDYDSSLFTEHEMLLKLTDIQDDFSLIMQRWFNMYQNIESVLDSYFGVQYNLKLYGENRFLMLAQAVESYHRKTKINHILSKEEHEQRLQIILKSTPEKHQEWLKEKLNFSNEPTLKERIEELVSLHWLVMKSIILDKEQFVKDVKNTRNYYTHFSESLKNKALTGTSLFRLTQKLNFLLQACFLSELGCTPEKCLELISRNGEYTYLQRLVNQEKTNS